MLEVLRSALLRYILHTCPNLWKRSGSKCYAMPGFGIHIPYPVVTFVFTVLRHELLGRILSHAQACDNVRVPSATQCTASVHIQHFTHAQTCDNVRVASVKQCTASILSHARACDNVRLFKCYAIHWFGTFSTLHMPKPVITFVFQVWRNTLLRHILYKVLSNALLRYILHTCPMPEPMKTFGFKVLRDALLRYTHSLSCGNIRVHSATPWTAWAHTFTCPSLW